MTSLCNFDKPDYRVMGGTRACMCNRSCLYVPSMNSDMLSRLCEDIGSIEDVTVRTQAMDFCDSICRYLYDHGPVALPELFFSMDDGDAFFEWMFDNFRFGFLFCKDPMKSGWYLVSKVTGEVERLRSSFKGKETMDYIFDYIGANA